MRVILIGFMGVGKTSVGKALAQKLNIDFIDTDFEIEKITNKTITDIFEGCGEKHFRKLENEVLKDLVRKNDNIISTGGGIIVSKEVYKSPLLIDSKNLYKKIDDLISTRYEKYKDVCNIRIDVNGKNIDEVVSQILVYF